MKQSQPLILILFLSICIGSCGLIHEDIPTLYEFTFNQPDGTIPEEGWAIIYEKKLDPTTGYTINLTPISDTLYWNNGVLNWTDDGSIQDAPLTAKLYSYDSLTDNSIRQVWHNLDKGHSQISLTFPLVRPVKVSVRQSEPLPSPAYSWAFLTSHLSHPTSELFESNFSGSQFDAWSIVEQNHSQLNSTITFRDHNNMYIHLYRLDSGTWYSNGTLTASITANTQEFIFNIHHTSACCD